MTTKESIVPHPMTLGIHHVGLAVPDLDAACKFFCEALDWVVIARNDQYPSAFVSDGTTTLTLWRVANPASRNILEKCGFQWSGVELHRFEALGSSTPVDCFRLSRGVWSSLKNWASSTRRAR